MSIAIQNQLADDLNDWIEANPVVSDVRGDESDPMVIAKLFDAFGSGTWLVTEYDRESRTIYGFVTGLAYDEWGSASLDEMAEITAVGGVPRIELDLHFRPQLFSSALDQHRSTMDGQQANSEFDQLQGVVEALSQSEPGSLSLSDFITDFSDGLLDAVAKQNPPVFEAPSEHRTEVMKGLLRPPFEPQADVVQAMATLLLDRNQPAGIINAEMGTGKTMMAIALAAVCHAEGIHRSLVICPPHLVYKWRREIKETVPNARVWVLNGPDTLAKLLMLRAVRGKPAVPEFYVMGRVRMRLGYHWRPVFRQQRIVADDLPRGSKVCVCPDCQQWITDDDGGHFTDPVMATTWLNKQQRFCRECGGALWTLMRPSASPVSRRDLVVNALKGLPTIGSVTANRLVDRFGDEMLGGMLADNVYELINLMDEDGELIFSDKQATRMERALARSEFSFGQGGYQATEFIKKYLPANFFGLLIVDEGHEFKNQGSAQGQAFGVLAAKCRKTVLLTGTLMGGYADDLFFLLWRLNPKAMIEDGFHYRKSGLGSASMAFMRSHGVIKDISRSSDGAESESHRTARGRQVVHRTARGPGFGPLGIMRYVVPITAFLKLSQIGAGVLPAYNERFIPIVMRSDQEALYKDFQNRLKTRLRDALRAGDHSLLGVVLNALLAWPDCGFRPETVRHPHKQHDVLASLPAIFSESEAAPKEEALLQIIRDEKARGRKVLAYTVYTGQRDTTARLKAMIEAEGHSVAVLRSSVKADQREDWLLEQVDRGVDVVLTNPELVKTGLDMLAFPTIVFMQSGYNVYTLQQAARRSWRIGQKRDVDVLFLGYSGTAQMACLQLMAEKIAVSQSTSGDMPESGLDVLNQSGDSIEVALARQLVSS
jgi:superfamily II DNA or RNA helicase